MQNRCIMGDFYKGEASLQLHSQNPLTNVALNRAGWEMTLLFPSHQTVCSEEQLERNEEEEKAVGGLL